MNTKVLAIRIKFRKFLLVLLLSLTIQRKIVDTGKIKNSNSINIFSMRLLLLLTANIGRLANFKCYSCLFNQTPNIAKRIWRLTKAAIIFIKCYLLSCLFYQYFNQRGGPTNSCPCFKEISAISSIVNSPSLERL